VRHLHRPHILGRPPETTCRSRPLTPAQRTQSQESPAYLPGQGTVPPLPRRMVAGSGHSRHHHSLDLGVALLLRAMAGNRRVARSLPRSNVRQVQREDRRRATGPDAPRPGRVNQTMPTRPGRETGSHLLSRMFAGRGQRRLADAVTIHSFPLKPHEGWPTSRTGHPQHRLRHRCPRPGRTSRGHRGVHLLHGERALSPITGHNLQRLHHFVPAGRQGWLAFPKVDRLACDRRARLAFGGTTT
jgi:hypothetical protein